MSLVKPAALFVCVALAGCASKSDSARESWWKLGEEAHATQTKPAAVELRKDAKASSATVAGKADKAETPTKGSWWSFGGEEKTVAKTAEPKKAEVSKVSQAWLDDKEALLKKAVAGSKFEVERRGDVLVLVAPVDVSFNPDRPHMLLPVTLGPLSRVAKMLEGDPQSAVLILGHADSSGDAALNRKVSLERAQSVASIFRMSGLKSDRLMLRGIGADRPRATNDSTSGRAQNRRVEVLLTLRDSLPALVAQNGR